MAAKTLYILYNADSSLIGKLRYGYKKVCHKNPDSNPECAACEITHGGLSLYETQQWVKAKREMQASGSVRVVQWHRDEVSEELRKYIEGNKVQYPAAVVNDGEGFTVVADRAELATYKGDAQAFVKAMKEKLLSNLDSY